MRHGTRSQFPMEAPEQSQPYHGSPKSGQTHGWTVACTALVGGWSDDELLVSEMHHVGRADRSLRPITSVDHGSTVACPESGKRTHSLSRIKIQEIPRRMGCTIGNRVDNAVMRTEGRACTVQWCGAGQDEETLLRGSTAARSGVVSSAKCLPPCHSLFNQLVVQPPRWARLYWAIPGTLGTPPACEDSAQLCSGPAASQVHTHLICPELLLIRFFASLPPPFHTLPHRPLVASLLPRISFCFPDTIR